LYRLHPGSDGADFPYSYLRSMVYYALEAAKLGSPAVVTKNGRGAAAFLYLLLIAA
jgi:hypothetical protein